MEIIFVGTARSPLWKRLLYKYQNGVCSPQSLEDTKKGPKLPVSSGG